MKFCPECGVKLVSQKFCHECGANITKYLNGEADSSNGLGSSLNFDFSSLQSEAEEQLAKQKMLEDFEIEDGVLKKYKGKGGKVVIPKEVKIIGENAFRDNADVTDIDIPDSVEKIESCAFWGVSNLKKINIPESVNELGRGAFGKTGLQEIVLPSGIQRLSGSMFHSCSELKRVELPPSLKVIEDGVFLFTDKLLAIFIPRSVQEMRENVFAYSNIVDIYFEADSLPPNIVKPNEYYHTSWRGECYAAEHFSCTRDSVIIPDYDVEAQAYGADSENYNKEDFDFNGGWANCLREMTTVRFPYGTRKVTQFGMKSSLNAQTIIFPRTTTVVDFSLMSTNYGVENTTLQTVYAEGLVQVEARAFYNCVNLTSFYNSDSLQIIDDEAFSDCSNLTRFTFPKMIKKLGSSAFCKVPALRNIRISGTLTEIGGRSFHSCPNLESVVIDEGIIKIESHAFCNCKKLKKVVLPSTLEEIEGWAFSGCERLDSVEIPEGVKTLGTAAFQNCKSLRTIKIPYSMQTMDTSWKSFEGCDNLQFVYLPKGRKEAFMRAFPSQWGDTPKISFIEY